LQIELQSYKIEIPDPPSKKYILGHDKHIADQVFTPTYTLTDKEFDRLSHEQQSEIVEIENERCANGYYMYINGNATYIPPDFHFWMNFYTIDGKKPDYIENQRGDFVFYEYVENDSQCYGSLELKPRREGCTHRKLSKMLNKARLSYDQHFGILSKTGDDAQEMNFGNLVKAYARMPIWMKPTISGEFPPKTTLTFATPAQRATMKNKSKFQVLGEDSLNTYIDWANTSEIAYDGFKLKYLLFDESAKWTRADAYKAWITHKKCLEDGYDIIGKCWMLSTIEGDEDKDASAKSIQNFIKLWNESNPNDRNSMGRTSSGLYRWFIPAQLSKRGKSPLTGIPLVDKYGNVDEAEVLKLIQIEIDSKKTPQEKLLVRRQNPRTVQEAISTIGTGTTFVNIQERLVERHKFLENYKGTPERPLKYRTGRLEWLNNERFTKAVFRDDPSGLFNIAYLPNIAGAGMDNKVKEITDGRFMPFSDSPFVIGLDPIEYEEVQYGDGSKAGFHVKCKYNIFNPELSDVYCLEYLGRPDIPSFREDLYKAMFLYGARINVERQASKALFEALELNGMKSFILKRQLSWNKKTDKDKSPGTPTSPRSIQTGLEYIENYFSPPNPELNENEKDNLEYFWFDRTLKQCMDYDIREKVKFDLVSSMMQTEFASQFLGKRFILKAREQQENNLRNPNRATLIDYLYPVYVNGEVVTHNSLKNDNNARPHRRTALQRQ